MNPYRCETCKFVDNSDETNKIFGLKYCSKCDLTLEPVFLDQISLTGCASHSENRILPISNNKMCEMCSKSERADEREKLLEKYTELLKQKIIKSDLKSECFDRLSMIIHDTITELRKENNHD